MKTNKAKVIQTPEQAVKSKEQIDYERKITKQRLSTDVNCLKRELIYKELEVSSGNIMEKNESKFYMSTTVAADDIKPRFIIENEIDIIKQKLSEIRDRINEITNLEEEDAEATKS